MDSDKFQKMLDDAANTPPPLPVPHKEGDPPNVVDSGHWSDALEPLPATDHRMEFYMAEQQARAEVLLNELAKTIVPPPSVYASGPVPQITADTTAEEEIGQTRLARDLSPLDPANLPLPAAITLAESLKAEIVDAERRLKDELAEKLKTVEAIEKRVRDHVLMRGASYTEAHHMKVNYVKAAEVTKWNNDKLMGFAAALNPDQKAGLLACRTVEVKPASTSITYK